MRCQPCQFPAFEDSSIMPPSVQSDTPRPLNHEKRVYPDPPPRFQTRTACHHTETRDKEVISAKPCYIATWLLTGPYRCIQKWTSALILRSPVTQSASHVREGLQNWSFQTSGSTRRRTLSPGLDLRVSRARDPDTNIEANHPGTSPCR